LKNQFADLHIHSFFSDGLFTPQEILEKAKEVGLSCIAVTDHDCVDALPLLIEKAPFYSIEVIPAVELTSEVNDTEVHILGYLIDYQEEKFINKLREICSFRKERMQKMIEKLRSFGININYQEVLEERVEGSVGRMHLAQILLKHGYVKSIPEAFYKYIGNHAPCYVGRFKLNPSEAIRIIQEVKGIPVLAHPYKINNDELIESLIREGIKGIEVYHPDHSSLAMDNYLDLAKRNSLLVTGGSDCHGIKGKRELGSIKIDYHWVEEMKERRNDT